VTRPPRWLSGFGLRDWGGDAQAYASLLDALTRDRVETEALEREMSAPAAAHNTTDVHKMERHELDEARHELDRFRAALDDVNRRAAGNPGAEVAYDSAKQAEDGVADVLIQYLVRPGYADVRTEERGSGHYIYWIRVDWPKLRALAIEQGHPLAK
jgi:hypothetical protein